MSSTKQMTPGEVVQNYLNTFFEKDVEKTLKCLTDDVRWKVQGAATVPTIGERKGKGAVRDWLALFPLHFVPLTFRIDRIFEQDNQVVITGDFKHRILDTGREFESDFAAICEVRDGKICAYSFIEDSYGLWRAFQPL